MKPGTRQPRAHDPALGIVSPDGDVLAVTSRSEPFATVDVDLANAERAKSTYPRYALD